MKTPNNKHNAEHISADELQRYFDGEMSNAEMRALEQQLDNDFNSDAFDGFEANRNALSDMDGLKDRFNNEVIGKKAGNSSTTIKYLTYATGIAAILVIGFFIFSPDEPYIDKQNLENEMPITTVDTIEEDDADSTSIVIDETINGDSILIESPTFSFSDTSNNDIIATEEGVDSSILLQGSGNVITAGRFDNIPSYTADAVELGLADKISLSDSAFKLSDIAYEEEVIETATPIEPSLQITYSNTLQDQRDFSYNKAEKLAANGYGKELKDEEALDKKTLNALPIKYIIDLKVVNYDDRETPEVNDSDKVEMLREKHKSKSISPRFSNPENQAARLNNNVNYWNSPEVTEIPYDDFLADALEKFKKKEYKQALNDFTIILDTYPDDANALFYGGLCYYNLNLTDKAINYFGLLSNTPFDEEAEWYQALSYKLKGDDNKAKSMLKVITDKNGFYSKRASEMLNNY